MSNPVDAMDFVAKFAKYFDDVGIADKYEPVGNKMVTSDGVYELVKEARGLLPTRLAGGEAARTMRELSDGERNDAITSSSRVIDAREIFSRKIADHGAARGLIAEFIDALSNAHSVKANEVVELMQKFVQAERQEVNFKEEQNVE